MLKPYKALDAVIVTSTSDEISLVDAKKVTFFFKADVTSGNGVFKVEVSPDGEEWVQYNKLISNIANTNGQTLTRVATVTLSTDTTETYSMDVTDCFQYCKVTVTRTTDGTYDAWVIVQK